MARRGRPRHPDILTPREWDVLALLREGLTNEQIAERLEITERTARFHVSEILSKLGVSTRQEAAAWQPEERPSWWSIAIAPVAFSRAHRWLATAALGVAAGALVAAVVLVLWAMTRTHGSDLSRSKAAPPTQVPAQAGIASSIAVGQNHACAVVNGEVFCWGQSYDSDATKFQAIDSPVSKVAAGTDSTCALMVDHTVRCWGNNHYGQLGDVIDNPRNATPAKYTQVFGLGDVVDVSVGANHDCALTAAGAVECWGDNTYGQLGDGTTAMRVRPVTAVGLESGAQAVSVGGNFTCALTREGAAKCWGSNSEGQLGTTTGGRCGPPGFVFGCNTTPRAVDTLNAGVTRIGASPEGQHVCAVITDGSLDCWGANLSGQLGMTTTGTCSSPTSPCATTPTAVPGVEKVTAIALGMYHTCAAESGGAVKCWGDNLEGQLGNGTTTASPGPVVVRGIEDVVAMGAGQLNTCALTSAKAVLCWGADGGTGTGVPSGNSCNCAMTPTAVYGLLSQQRVGTPVPPDQLVWYEALGAVVRAASPTCGDSATATKYNVPRMLTAAEAPGNFRLGLEAEPYPYVAAQVSLPLGGGRKPIGWELTHRVPLILGPILGGPANGFPVAEFFLRRLDEPSVIFRYSADLCTQTNGRAGPYELNSKPTKSLRLPAEVFLPKVVEHEHGDFITAKQAIKIAAQTESAHLARLKGEEPSSSDDLNGEKVVWAELGTNSEITLAEHYTPEDHIWFVVFELGDGDGPQRPGHMLGRYYEINAKSGFIQVNGWCCIGLISSR